MTTFLHHSLCPVLQAIIAVDENIAKELAPVILQDLREVILYLFHRLVVGSYACAYKTEWVRVAVNQVHATLFDILEDVLGHVEACRATPNDCKAELLVRLDHHLLLDSLAELWVVVFCRVKGGSRVASGLWRVRYGPSFSRLGSPPD